ncbi:MAG: cytochrome P450, partial [Candidatus Micrarchaeaceae archaeon]
MSDPFKRDFYNDFDLNDPELAERWDELVPHMHAGCPVARSEIGEKYWVLNRYEDVVKAAKDWETFSASSGFWVNRPAEMPYFKPGECDPPIHDRLRETLMPFLRPNVVAPLESRIRFHADALIDSFIEEGAVDVVDRFANTLPALVFSVEVVGMDPVDMPLMLKVFSLTGAGEERSANFVLGLAK